ncbi:MAG: hypothetical protein ABL931_16215 [Usitatibacteraceae bacterium]
MPDKQSAWDRLREAEDAGRRDMPAHGHKKPETATVVDAHKELAAVAAWAKANGCPNVYYRINWALRVLMANRK